MFSFIKKREKNMGTWEDESCELLESQNEINKDVSSDETYRDGNGVDVNVKVEVIITNGDRTDNDECCDHENNVATEEVALVEQPERVELQTNDSDGSKIEDGKIEQHGEYDEEENNQVYPLRPAFEDCSFYVKTGTCKFGQNCRYNHPPSGGFQPVGDKEKGFEESIRSGGDAGKITCKYYQTAGGCKYGDSCRYNHSARRIQRKYLELNFLGLPLRPLAQDCTFYLQNGSCGYGANCRFHHPNPTPNGESVRGGVTLPINYAGEPVQSFGGVSQTKSHSPNGINQRNGPCDGPEMSSFHQIIPPTPGWDRSQASSSHPTNKIPLPHQVMNFSKRVDPLTHHRNPVQIGEFPERPGQSDCDYFMKTGDCKYGTACRYNHPRSQMYNSSLPLLSSKHLYSSPAPKQHVESCQFVNLNSNMMRKNRMSFGQHQNQQIQNEEFPERAGEPECEYYMKTGQCKYKSACRYHHPRSRVPNSSQSRCALSEKGLPLRPGARLCRNYEQQGMCKYGKICLYDHPEDYSPDIPPVTTQFDSLTHVPPTAANLGPPAADNVNSSWNDGWET